jgi:hypothetical protein
MRTFVILFTLLHSIYGWRLFRNPATHGSIGNTTTNSTWEKEIRLQMIDPYLFPVIYMHGFL